MAKIKEFDIIKIILIFSIICAHLSPIDNIIKINSIISWLYNSLGILGVPIFYFISGYLFYNNKKSFKHFFLNKIKNIIIPWIFVGTVCYLIVFLFQNNISLIGFLNFIIGKGSYLYYLTILILLYILFFKYKDNFMFLLITFILGIVSIIYNIYYGIHEYSYINLLNWIPYFNIGLMTNKYNKLNKVLKFCKKNKFLFLITFILVLISGLYLNSKVNYWTLIGIILIILFFFTTFGFIYKCDNKYKILNFIGENSLSFYLIHMPIAGIIVRISNVSSILILLRPIITIFITYLVIYLYKKIVERLNLNNLKLLIGVK